MFKTGVYSEKQLRKGATRTIFGATKNVSVTLLEAVRQENYPTDASSSVMFSLNDERGTYKRTYKARFGEFDSMCSDLIVEQFSKSNIRIHDVAISSGETAVDFFLKLSDSIPNLAYFASDYDPLLTIIRRPPIAVAMTSQQSVVEILLPPFVFAMKKPDHFVYPLNHLIRSIVSKTWVSELLNRYKNGEIPESQISTIDLFCPDAQKLASQDSRFNLGQFDILERSDDSYDCIRAMNVLNKRYFSDREFQSILQNFHQNIEESGLLVIGSNSHPGSLVNGAIYRKNASKFLTLWSSDVPPHADKHVQKFNSR